MRPGHAVAVKPGDVLLVPGDVHFGTCDLPLFDLMLKVSYAAGVNLAVLQGDTFDCGGLSTHRKDARAANSGRLTIRHEVEQAMAPLAALSSLVNGRCWSISGNHEERIARMVDDLPALEGVSWATLYGKAMEGWHVLPHGSFVSVGPVSIYHGHELTGMKYGGGVTPAKTVLTQYPGQHTIFGHTHRRDSFTRPTWKNGRKVAHGAWNVGHLQDESQVGWSGHNAWEQSFAVVSFFEGDLFDVGLARVCRDKRNRPSVLLNGVMYR